ncbi:hypothetical protein IP95_02466 [Extensimonas vulgaris]|uniref:Uncharacterized protein n=2 Tax=Extensimonas vulgaris TaxID=1031594 RepID=A0A369AKG3_9BURK|nr:hypothetical protein DFR45_108148 [Extensimonas vulgaris]TWI36262.1 hypothetical protein IP95_02466 [Extensimonas vulgaris]
MKPRSCAQPEDELPAMLDALADDIDHCPDILRDVPADLVERIRLLTAGVEADLEQPLPPELDDEGMS